MKQAKLLILMNNNNRILFRDTFTDTDDVNLEDHTPETGNSWIKGADGYNIIINSNHAVITVDSIYLVDVGENSYDVTINYKAGIAEQWTRFYWAMADIVDKYFFEITPTRYSGSEWFLYKRSTTFANGRITWSPSVDHKIRITVSKFGIVTVYADTTQLFQFLMDAYQTNTKVGIGYQDYAGVYFDDILVRQFRGQSSIPYCSELLSATATNAATPLTIPTYDESGQVVHPDVIDTGVSGWNSYRYWMVMTPYPASDETYENPSVVASNDKTTWVVPEGLTNPIVANLADGSYWSDPDMAFVNNKLYMVYRLRLSDNVTDILYISESSNGTTWSDRVEIMRGGKNEYQSPSLVYKDSLWYLFFHNETATPNTYYLKTSSDIYTGWSSQKQLYLNNHARWSHVDIIYDTDRFYGLFHTDDYNLYLGMSEDGINWTRKLTDILLKSTAPAWDSYGLYRASIVKTTTGLDLYYTGKVSIDDWQVGLTEITWSES